MTKLDLQTRLQLCQEQSLDFVSLQPFKDGVVTHTLYHNELECVVPTKYTIQSIEKLPEAIAR